MELMLWTQIVVYFENTFTFTRLRVYLTMMPPRHCPQLRHGSRRHRHRPRLGCDAVYFIIFLCVVCSAVIGSHHQYRVSHNTKPLCLQLFFVTLYSSKMQNLGELGGNLQNFQILDEYKLAKNQVTKWAQYCGTPCMFTIHCHKKLSNQQKKYDPFDTAGKGGLHDHNILFTICLTLRPVPISFTSTTPSCMSRGGRWSRPSPAVTNGSARTLDSGSYFYNTKLQYTVYCDVSPALRATGR